MKSTITEDMWADWLGHPVTEALLRQVLPARLEELRNKWEAGDFTDQSQFATAISNAAAIGQCKAIRWVMELNHETLQGELEDDESERLDAGGQGSTG